MPLPRCIVVDDETLAVERLCNLLNQLKQVEVVETALAPEKAIKEILSKKPDIVFIDVEMPRMSGFELVKEVRANLFNPTFIFVTAYNQYAIKAIKTEAFDFIIKPVDIDELHETIDRFLKRQNGFVFPENCILSNREKEILRLVSKGKTSREIGELLHISKHTVDTHRRKIIEKTGNKTIAYGHKP